MTVELTEVMEDESVIFDGDNVDDPESDNGYEYDKYII